MNHRLTLILALFSTLIGGDLLAQGNAQQNRQRTDSFQRFFTLPEIEFSEEQQMKIAEMPQGVPAQTDRESKEMG